jgi:galactose mutarotase-like enzyme
VTTLPDDWVRLSTPQLSAAINPQGAQLSVLRDVRGTDLQWNGDPAVWSGRAPLLFPIVGTLAGGSYRLGSRTYQLPRHGFARNRRFQVIAISAARALFRLQADAETLAVYPFRFELDVEFALAGASLTLTTTVRNVSEEDMPASLGYHPAFLWPLPYGQARSSHFIEFACDEPDTVRRLNGAGLLSAERIATPIEGRRLALRDELFANDALILDQVRSREVTYGASEGPRIRIGIPDSPYLGIWSKPGAGFVCIEPWQGIADPQGFSGDFHSKPGVFIVPPAATKTMQMAIALS